MSSSKKIKSNTDNLTKPSIIGYMSTNVSRDYLGDISQLKFLYSVPKGTVHFDLNHRINEAVKRTTDDNDEKIELLLKFLTDRIQNISLNRSFVSYRRSLISIMCNAYHNDHVRIVASIFNGSIYLCSLETPQEKQRKQTQNRQKDKFSAWGYKFEQYLLSDLPNISPDIEKPVIENEEFTLYYHSTLGDHDMVYGAQIDGLLANKDTVQDLPDSNDFEKVLNYLRNNEYIELKTNREIENARQEQNFKRFKMLRCWCQCYLAGLKGLLVGFRDDRGVIKRLQCFDTHDIVEYCKYEWQPEPAIRFLDHFLSYVKNCFRNHSDKENVKPVSLIFDVRGNNSIQVSECSDDINILPEWFINKMKPNYFWVFINLKLNLSIPQGSRHQSQASLYYDVLLIVRSTAHQITHFGLFTDFVSSLLWITAA